MRVKMSCGEAKIRVRFEGIAQRRTTIDLDVDGFGFTASAHCSPKDRFVKSIGRKVALTTLLKSDVARSIFTKEDRALLWRTVCPEFFRTEAKRHVA